MTARPRALSPIRLLAVLWISLTGSVVALGPAQAGAPVGPWVEQTIDAGTTPYGVAMDTDMAGDAVAMWATGDELFGARRPAGGWWSAPVDLGAGYHFSPESVALLENGATLFAYSDDDLEGGVVGRWDTDDTVSGTGVGGHDDDTMLWSDPTDGDVVVGDVNANRGGNERTRLYLVTAATPNGSWTSVTHLDTLRPVVAFGAGHDYAVADLASRREVRVRRIDAGTGTGTRSFFRDPQCGEHPTKGLALRLDDEGRGVVAWRCAGDRGAIRTAYLRADGAGATVDLVHSRAGVDDVLSGPVLAAAPDGRVTAVWGVKRTAGTVLRSATRGPRGDWSSTVTVASGQSQVWALGVGAAQSGAAVVTWTDDETVRAMVRRPGGGFSAAETITTVPRLSYARPSIVEDGTAFATVSRYGEPDPVSVFVHPLG